MQTIGFKTVIKKYNWLYRNYSNNLNAVQSRPLIFIITILMLQNMSYKSSHIAEFIDKKMLFLSALRCSSILYWNMILRFDE